MVRVCVPLFFMVSGFLLLQKQEPLGFYFSKRFKKLLVPIIFWSLFFILWKNIVENGELPKFEQFYSLLLKPSYYHLWFLYALIGIYLFVPILRIVTNSTDNKLLVYYCLIWFLAVSVIPFIEKVIGVDSKIDLHSISGYIGYLVLGYILGKKTISLKVFIFSVAIYLLMVIFTASGTYYLTLSNDGKFSDYLYSYLAPNTIIAAISCFILIKYVAINSAVFNNTTLLKMVKKLSACSFGIYLIHPVFIYLFKTGSIGLELSAFSGDPLLFIPLTSLIVFLLSFFMVLFIKKIPVINLIAP
jgi:surface polysaccharide O-acyltransferase-like enzyme